MKKLFILLAIALCSTSLFAYDFEKDGIYYNILGGDSIAVTYGSRDVYAAGDNTYYCYYNTNGEYLGFVTIPSTVDYNSTTYRVTTIGDNAFHNCSSLTAITIPNSITTISAHAFSGCSSLTSVSWNAKSCSDCTGCPFPATQIAIMNFGESVEHIPAYLCKGMDKLLSLKLPDAVKTIGNNAFNGCSSLKRLTLGKSIASIGNYAFANCTNLPEIALPQSVETIGNYAFSGDVAFTTMLIPDAVTTIGSYAYKGCTSLNTVTIGKAVTTINNNAFEGCTALQTIAIPDNVTTLGANAFVSCTSLQSVTIGNGLSQVSEKTFSGCSTLQTVEIGKSIASFGTGAFYNCKALQTVSINTATPPAVTYYNNKTSSNYAFYGVPTTAEFLIPCAAAEEYEYSPYWQGLTVVTSIPAVLSVQTANATYGTAVITQENTCDNAVAIITANPAEGYRFTTWNDGNTKNPRTIEVIEDITYTASFERVYSVTGVTLDITSLQLAPNETQQLTATVLPDNATNPNITWSSSVPAVATVQNGLVTALSNGTTIVTVTTEDGSKKATCEVTVRDPMTHVESITLDATEIKLEPGNSQKLTATILPADATNKNFTWKSDNNAIAEVANGWVIAIAVGTTTITATTEDGALTATCRVRVAEAVTALNLRVDHIALYPNESYILNTVVAPESTDKSTFIWTTSNEDVATVADGVVTAHAVGKATITVATEDNAFSSSCLLTVVNTDIASNVLVETTDNSALFTWATVAEAFKYQFAIYADNSRTDLVCSLTCNAWGQLIGVSFPHKKPAVEQPALGTLLQFVVDGLKSGTLYSFTLNGYAEDETVVLSKSGAFVTTGNATTAIEECESLDATDSIRKVLENGTIYILRGGKKYTIDGRKVE